MRLGEKFSPEFAQQEQAGQDKDQSKGGNRRAFHDSGDVTRSRGRKRAALSRYRRVRGAALESFDCNESLKGAHCGQRMDALTDLNSSRLALFTLIQSDRQDAVAELGVDRLFVDCGRKREAANEAGISAARGAASLPSHHLSARRGARRRSRASDSPASHPHLPS